VAQAALRREGEEGGARPQQSPERTGKGEQRGKWRGKQGFSLPGWTWFIVREELKPRREGLGRAKQGEKQGWRVRAGISSRERAARKIEKVATVLDRFRPFLTAILIQIC
jgi:hypothetical protein